MLKQTQGKRMFRESIAKYGVAGGVKCVSGVTTVRLFQCSKRNQVTLRCFCLRFTKQYIKLFF